MALIFMDGFDHYATADITKKWLVNSGCSILPTTGRRGTGCMKLDQLSDVQRLFAASASYVIGVGIKVVQTGASTLFQLRDNGSTQCGVRLNGDQSLSIARDNGSGAWVTIATSAQGLNQNAWYYIEFKVTIADSISAGSCELRVNGITWITLSAGADVKATANATANGFLLGATGYAVIYYDDLYVCDASGSTNNDFLGDCRVDPIFPVGDGNYSQMTPSIAGAHYTLVDEATPNTTDYVSSSTVNQIDTYTMQDLANVTGSIFGVQACVAAQKDDAGSRAIAAVCRSVSTDALGPNLGLGTLQLYGLGVFEKNPATNAAWTQSEVNAAELGVKVTL